jgi:MSHA pilin protein MshD
MTRRARAQGGFTLIDVVLLIVVMGVLAAAISQVSGSMAAQSARSVRDRQMLALAQGLLEEIRQTPFTYCDGGRANSSAACGPAPIVPEVMGVEGAETRYGPNRFDSVTDYQNFAMPGPGCAGLCDLYGNVINPAGSPLQGCSAGVLLAAVAMNGVPANDASNRPQSVRVRVTVACPGSDPLMVETLRVRHAPNNF